jgi:hypothetical protein
MRRVLALIASLCLAGVLTASALAGDGRLSFTTGNFVGSWGGKVTVKVRLD